MRVLIMAGVALGLMAAHGQDVRVVKTTATKTSLDLAGFGGAAAGAAGVFRNTLNADLKRCGWFVFATPGAFTVSGFYGESGADLATRCQVVNVAKAAVVLNQSYSDTSANAQRLAHKVADDIIFATKGIRGICSGRMVMVGRQSGKKELYLCDADGGNLRQLTRDGSISLAPSFSPSGEMIAYTSFKGQFPDAYVINLRTGARTCVANYPGINMAGQISPSGQELALILSKDGNPELYIKNLASGALTRLTQTKHAGEASPTWSPDGSQLAYVSDAAGVGSPQIYVTSRGGGGRRLTTRGRENVTPHWGPNGWIAFCSRRGGLYGIYVINPASGEERTVSPGDAHYEDPCWAADGRHLVCTKQEGRGSRIYMLDTMGDPPLCLTPYGGDWFSPAWSTK